MSSFVTVIGSGIVGRCWSSLFIRGGFKVKLYDIQNTDAAVKDIQKTKLPLLQQFDMLNGKNAQELEHLISGTSSLKEALDGTSFVQECVPEKLNLKQSVHRLISNQLLNAKNNKAIIGSSSSNLCSSLFANNLRTKDRTLIVHPINPPFAIPLVELVPSPATNPEIIKNTKELMITIGMSPVTLKKELDGFAVNRLQYALLAEAYRLVEDGALSSEDVDTVVSKGLGLRWSFMGPFQTIDLNANGLNDYCEKFSQSIERVVKAQNNNRPWQPKTYKQIDKAMRKLVNLTDLKQRIKWRDWRLMELVKHQKMMEETEWLKV